MARARSFSKNNSSASLGFEAKLWLAADKLRSNLDAADWSSSDKTSSEGEARRVSAGSANQYKHVVLGLIFLKYIGQVHRELTDAAKHEQAIKANLNGL